MDDILKDERFSHIAKDRRFRRVPLSEKRVKIDKRFKGMFSDKKFKLKYTVDKRGRPINSSTSEDLNRFYELDSDDESSDEDNEHSISQLKEKKKVKKKTRKCKNMSDDSDEDITETDYKSGPDLARGEGNMESSSDEEEDEDDEPEQSSSADGGMDHNWSELDKSAPEAKELGRRLALCNLDWDRIKAVDIFVLLNSFKPTGGVIHSVKIYPSEYGLKRMKEEEVTGPQELLKGSSKDKDYGDDDGITEDAEGTKYHREKLRQYQLNRLKYYYAVAECDSIETANTIYGECDGMEYESSSTRLDLRFIPDDMTFDQEPKSTCNEMPSSSVYKPSMFLTSALCQSKVDLTWDETDHDRLKVTMRPQSKVDTVTEDDFKAYLASSSGEEDNPYGDFFGESENDSDESEELESEEKQIDKYRKLLQNIKESEKDKEDKDVEMEVTWEPGLKLTTEKLLKKKKEEDGSTAWEQYLLKKKEKKRQKREEKQKALETKTENKLKSKKETKHKAQKTNTSDEDEKGEDQAAFSDDDIPGGVDMSDPYFQEELDQPSKSKKGKGKKKKKKQKEELTEEEMKEKEQQEAELSLLMMDEKEDDKHHFNLKDLVEENKTKKKKKKKFKKGDNLITKTKLEDDFQIDVTDDRFSAMYTSHLYNLDPTAPEYKSTKGTEAIVKEKLKRSKGKGEHSSKSMKRKNIGTEELETKVKMKRDIMEKEHGHDETPLAALIKSVKTKTQKFNIKSKR